MNIALCGAGGTGKGTLAQGLVTAYNNVYGTHISIINSPVQDVAKMMYPYSENFSDITEENRFMFQYYSILPQMFMERSFWYNDLDYICERSVFDYLAYFNVGVESDIIKEGYSSYKRKVKGHYEEYPYDYVCFLGLDFIPADKEENKWKERDHKSREERDKILRKIIFEDNMAYKSTVIDLTGVEDKVKYILDTIR